MKLKHTALWSGVVAAALLLTACGKSNSGSGSMSSSGMSSSTASTAQNGAWKTGLGVLTETTDDHRTGKINLVAAAVLLDGEGKIIDVTFDELESTISADGSGVLSMPTDYRTKRQGTITRWRRPPASKKGGRSRRMPLPTTSKG